MFGNDTGIVAWPTVEHSVTLTTVAAIGGCAGRAANVTIPPLPYHE
jgi:hypothetical protein